MREARCELGASFVEGRSPECTENKRRDARTWASDRRSLIRERWVRRCLGRAASEGARAISVRGTRDGLSGRPGRYRAAGVFSYEVQGTGCSENQKGAQELRNSSRSRRLGHLIREEIIGHRMRGGRALAGGQSVGCVRGGTLALFHQPAGEHRAGIFIEPLVEQDSNFLAKVGGVTKPGKFVGLERSARSG